MTCYFRLYTIDDGLKQLVAVNHMGLLSIGYIGMKMNIFSSIYRRKIFVVSAVLCVLLVLSTFASASFIALETEHDCEGEDCHICECIELCEAILQQVGTALPVVTALLVFSVSSLFLHLPDVDVFCLRTPVSQKIRLNN